MNCPNCRRFTPPGAARCPACGTVYAAAPAAQSAVRPGATPRRRGGPLRAPATPSQPAAAGTYVPVSAGVRSAAAAALINQAARARAVPPAPGACPAPHKHPTASPLPAPAAKAPQIPPTSPPPTRTVVASVASAPASRVPEHPQVLPEGTVLAGSRYWLGTLLGRGSFGLTYRGLDQRLNRDVAIKEFFPEGSFRHAGTIVPPPSLGREGYEQERDHFLNEARVLAQVQRPNIVAVFDAFEQNDTAYMVMEHIEGRTLVEVLQARGSSLPPADAVRYILAVADALAAVHAVHLLHRDVKPGNIMITAKDEAVLIDFGAARRYDRYQRTSVMTAIGTPGYAPLEQWGSSGRFGPTSDVYALAATLYHLVTGRMPPSAADRAINDTLTPPRAINPAVPEPVDAAIVKALAVRMEERQQSMAAFAAALRDSRGARRSTAPVAAAKPGAAPARSTAQANAQVKPAAVPPRPSPSTDRAPIVEQRQPHRDAHRQARAAIREAIVAAQLQAEAQMVARADSKPGLGGRRSRRRRRFPWPRRNRDRVLWAAGCVVAPAVFVTSVAALITLVPFFAICSGLPSPLVRRYSRRLMRGSLDLSLAGIGVSTVSMISLVMVLGLAVRGSLSADRTRSRTNLIP